MDELMVCHMQIGKQAIVERARVSGTSRNDHRLHSYGGA